jgi:Fe2+ or Zn2+ uptake regulation protein
MPISPAPKVNEFHPSEDQVLAEIHGGSQWVSHSELLKRLARYTPSARMPVNEATVYYHLDALREKKGLIDQARRNNGAERPKMEMHYRRRAVR